MREWRHGKTQSVHRFSLRPRGGPRVPAGHEWRHRSGPGTAYSRSSCAPCTSKPVYPGPQQNWKDLAAELRIDLEELVARYPDIASNYTILSIFDKTTSIGSIELDRIYSGLTARNGKHERDVLLLLLSTGGSVEPAYRISKICKYFARGKFAVCVPRYAKSAATLISLGADEIHMGRLGELGPIDPQVQGLPALAVGRALEALAQLAQAYPGSSQMLADYLRQQLKVQQIGHFERVAESAVQYAQRLLGAKHSAGVLSAEPELIAKKLVHDYKDHGFVIDVDESRDLLGERWIREDSQETRFADDFYSLFDRYNWLLEMAGDSTLLLIGSLHGDDIARTFWAYPKKPRDS